MKRFTETEKWRDSWFQQLQPNFKLAWCYVLDACDHAGVFEPNLQLADFALGVAIDWPKFIKVCDKRLRVLESGKWFLTGFIRYQYNGVLNASNSAHLGAIRRLENAGIDPSPYLAPDKGLQRGYQAPKDKDKDKDKDTDKVKEPDKVITPEPLAKLRAIFRKRPTTPLDRSERIAWAQAAPMAESLSVAEWQALAAYYGADRMPDGKDYRRRNLATLLNNLSGEVTKAIAWVKATAPREVKAFADMKGATVAPENGTVSPEEWAVLSEEARKIGF